MAAETDKEAPAAKGLDPDKVLSEFKKRLAESQEHSRAWRDEARQLFDLKAGHQWSPEDEAALEEKYHGSYPLTTFNISNKYCNTVTGLQINNRQEIRYFPREQGDIGVDDFSTGVVKWCRDQAEAEDEETDTFEDAFWVGMGWVEHFLSEEDPENGFIAQERRDPIEMYWDPMARKKNLVDRRYSIRIKPMTQDEFEEFFGEDAYGLEGVSAVATDDASPQHIPVGHDYGDSGRAASGPKPVYVADYQFCRNKQAWNVRAVFPEAGELTQVFQDSEWRQIKPALERANVPFEAQRVATKLYYRAWICGDTVKDKIRVLPCGFTYEAITGQRDRNTNTWYGMGRIIRDPQLWVNKFFASILYTLSVNAKGGLMAEEDAFEDQAKAERSWANPAAITYTSAGAISQGKIQPKPPAPYPQGMDRLMEFTLNLMPLTSGMNPELMGLSDRNQPGVLEAQRKQSAIAIVAWVFDAMRRYYKRSGKLMLSMIREYMGEGQLIRISGPEGAKYVPLIKDKLVAKYDVVVDEAPTSVNMRERVWALLERMIPMALAAQIPVPPDVLDYAPLPADLSEKWKNHLKPSPQKQQQQQEQAAIAKEGAAATIDKDRSSAELNRARAAQAAAAVQSQPITDALTQAQAIKTAAEAGQAQAGGQ